MNTLWYKYHYRHVPTGKLFEGSCRCESQCEFLRKLNEWNHTATWQYWATDILGTVDGTHSRGEAVKDQFILVHGYEDIVEGRECYDTAEEAYKRAHSLFLGFGIDIQQAAAQALQQRGEFQQDGDWIRLENSRG